MSLIEVRDLHKRYGEKDVLKNINIKIEQGEVLAILGPTGAGKTTLLYLLGFLEAPTSGRIYFDGIDVSLPERVKLEIRRRVTFVLQKPVLFNTTVYENIAYGLRCRGVKKASLCEKVDKILEMVSLSDYKNRNAKTLSGGEAQRVAIARAIAVEPKVLLLDEPTANLDSISTSRMERLIKDIIEHYHTTIIMATHDLAQGQRLADRIAVLINGEVYQAGSPQEVFTSPRNKEVAEFMGIENFLHGVIIANKEGIVTVDVGGITLEAVSTYPVGEKVSLYIRPEDITLSLSPAQSSARNSFMGEITRIVWIGALSRVEIDCGFLLIALVTKKSAEELNLEKRKKVYATFKATAVHIIKRGPS